MVNYYLHFAWTKLKYISYVTIHGYVENNFIVANQAVTFATPIILGGV